MDAEIDRLKEDFKKVYHSKIQTTKDIKELAKKILEEKGLLYNSLNLNNIATKVFLYD